MLLLAQKMEELGAGEFMLTSMDKDDQGRVRYELTPPYRVSLDPCHRIRGPAPWTTLYRDLLTEGRRRIGSIDISLQGIYDKRG